MKQADKKIELLGIPREKLGEIFKAVGEKPFRAKQVMKWIYSHSKGLSSDDFMEMTDLPRAFRVFLAENSCVTVPENVEVFRSSDGSAKFLFTTDNEEFFEAVYIPDHERKRHTVCLSCQIGCRWNCSFCATGTIKKVKNLRSSEIVGQLLVVREYIRQGGNELTNVVFMGMGEPMDNLHEVINSIKVIISDVGFGLGHRRVLISTAGIPEGINRLINSDVRPKLAISLNAPDDELRSKIMPINEVYPIKSWLELIPQYAIHSKRWVTLEYVMFQDVNDTLVHADALVHLVKGLPVKVNLIPYNEVAGFPFKRPQDRILLRFQSYLLANGISATIRYSKGRDINGACGQLVGKKIEEK